MRLLRITGVGVLLALAGCGGGDSDPPTGTGDVPNTVAASGLDARPVNTTCHAPQRPAAAAELALERAFSALSFSEPVAMIQAPADDSRWYVLERRGRVRSFAAQDAAASIDTVIDLSDRVEAGPGEAGLLGLAFHPNYATNGYVYLSYTGAALSEGSVLRSYLSRFTRSDGGTSFDPSSEVVLLSVDQPFGNHNGGHIAFGPDGFLYWGLGDGGSGGDPRGNGQNTRTLLGAMLRIDVDVSAEDAAQGATDTIPAYNPFAASTDCASGTGCPEIYAWGLRNPWRWSFDRGTGDLWLGDVGQGSWEEVDQIQRGGNYGWNVREGAHCYNAANCGAAGLIDPVAEYGRDVGQSITGGYVYRGETIDALRGRYVYADFVSGRIWALASDEQGGYRAEQLVDTPYNIASFAEDQDGELYVLHYGGEIYRLAAATATTSAVFPARLSQTGCVVATDPTQPATGLIPYTVNAPFWSDRAEKQRYFALPDGAVISVGSDGDWDFPIGSVLMKQFLLGGRLVETRLLVRHADGEWAGYSYEWASDQSDATLVVGGRTVNIDGQTWRYPSSGECLSCHTAAAGRSLGLESAQLNGELTYPSTGRRANQLSTLHAIGLFDATGEALAAAAGQAALADPYAMGPLGERARAYLHSNCAQCHRPGGPTPLNMDLRFATALHAANICDVLPSGVDLELDNARRVAPGDSGRSLLSTRMARRDAHAMPPLGSDIVDDAGLALIRAWIDSLSGCP